MQKKILIILSLMSVVVGSCTPTAEVDAEMIATSAAQTVEARFTQMAESTATPEPPPDEEVASATLTPGPTETAIPDSAPEGCLAAEFVNETIPDGTVLATGDYFMKSWTVLNTGTCTWHAGYKLVYWSGDILGGAAEYQFFEDVPPGATMTFPIQLLAPSEPGIYQGSWKFKSPSGYIFGVGAYNAPISVNINVGNVDDLEYGITSVNYTLDRIPDVGCPTNVHWDTYATVTVSGPMTFTAQFIQSDGNHTLKKTLTFTEAGSKTLKDRWTLFKGAGPAPRWVQLVVYLEDGEPVYYPQFTFVNNCPDVVD